MKIALITFFRISPGVRSLSAFLKREGHEISIFFLCPEEISDNQLFPENLKSKLSAKLKQYDIVGISVFSRYFQIAKDLSIFLKKDNHPFLIWGGIHPTMDPSGCIQYVDAVAIGEAEESMAELLDSISKGKNHLDTAGFWFNINGKIKANPLRPPLADITVLPVPDIGIDNHYYANGNQILPLDLTVKGNMLVGINNTFGRETYINNYVTVISRGCPHECAYCCSGSLNELFGAQRKKVRMRSLDSVFEEIQNVRKAIPQINFISIDDDNFIAQPMSKLEEFASRWKREINLDFKISASAIFVTEERLQPLVEAGLRLIGIGVQSGSRRVLAEIYNRKIFPEKIIEAAYVINKLKAKLSPYYDFIFDNPYETSRDRLETARLILKLPKPYAFQSYSLVYLPGTPIYRKAIADGIIESDDGIVIQKKTNQFNTDNVSYLKLVMLLLPSLPNYFGKLLTFKPLALFFDSRLWDPFFTVITKLVISVKKYFHLTRFNTSTVWKQ